MALGRLLLRLVVGGLFVGHGLQKLVGAFGGPGPEGTQKMVRSLGLHPPKLQAFAVGATETGGGALVALGLATPAAAAGLIGTMTTAIRTVHLKNGPWVTQGGYEYNLVLIAALTALVDGGPGPYSLDHLLGIDDTDARWALGALATGVAASVVVVELGRRAAARVEQQAADLPAAAI
jgi:putative oxidoreductase